MNMGRTLMIVGIILALFAVLKLIGLVASVMIRTIIPVTILIVALVILFAGYKMKDR